MPFYATIGKLMHGQLNQIRITYMKREVRVVPPYNQRDDLACLPRLVLIMFFVAIVFVFVWVVLKFMNVCKL
jgi:hypothetical protein